MNKPKVTIHTHATELPALPDGSYFHSRELMELCEKTPRHKPYMALVRNSDGMVVAHLLAIVRYRRSLLPPYLYTHVRMMGAGEYDMADDELSTNQLFSLMVEAITERLQNRTLYIEVSHLSQKMFGYKTLRGLGYFPIRWMNIHNSLHSKTPEERITERQMRRIKAAQERGATTKLVETDEEFRQFSKLLRHHNWFKPRRYLPDDAFFRGMMESQHGRLFITQWKDKVIGCCACAYSGDDAFLWYTASRRKSYAMLHPNAVTIWNAMNDAHARGCHHFRFVDVGLPFRHHPYRDFILSYGGKEVSTYRWFRINIRWMNRLAAWWWRE